MKKHYLLTTFFAILFAGTVQAQEQGFDLGSQRKESQDIQVIPGKKIDHHGLVVNPTPHSLTIDSEKGIELSKTFCLVDKKGKFANDLSFLSLGKKGIRLSVDYGDKIAVKNGIKTASGSYKLLVNSKGINVIGYDERGAFYALQTLRQIIQSPVSKEKLPYLECTDYPDLPNRGVVEGFYGTPWSHQVRLSLIDYYGKNKMNTYIYGPKDDPYHSSPNWRQPYPDKEAKNISELVQACKRNRVDFVWAIHPGKDIKWNDEDYSNLIHKFDLMYNLGVRAFAIFFDDISGEGTNPVKQVDLLNRLTADFVKVKGDVSPLVICPTDYSKLWANPRPTGSLAIYGKTLDPSVNVFWTGDAVCSDLTKETLDWVNSRINRPAYFWWNFPVTDYARHIIMQGPTYGLDNNLTNSDLCGLVSNPMEHGEASKLALYGVADYTWNISGYNPLDNWERGLVDLAPEAHEAYRTFAIHSCDTETGYRRAESWETTPIQVDSFSQADFLALKNEFSKIQAVPSVMERDCKNKLLMKELQPWLQEFGKLGKRGLHTMQLVESYKSGDGVAFWKGFVNNRMSKNDRESYEAHKSGTMVLQPFYETAMDDMASGFFKRLTGKVPAFYKGVGSFATIRTTQGKLMFDNDSTTFYHSGTSQKTDDWVGADLGCVRPVYEVRILQGRNSVDDVDYFDNAVLEYSSEGKVWTPLTGELKKQYVIAWKSDKPIEAQFIRLRKLQSDKRSWIAVRSFEVNPGDPTRLPFKIDSNNLQFAVNAFDENLCTSFINQDVLTFGVEKGVLGYTMLLKLLDGAEVKCRQLDIKGKLLAETMITTDFFKMSLLKKTAKIQIVGDVEIFEILPEK